MIRNFRVDNEQTYWFVKTERKFGRSKAKLNETKNKVTFKQVAGLDEEKEELEEKDI